MVQREGEVYPHYPYYLLHLLNFEASYNGRLGGATELQLTWELHNQDFKFGDYIEEYHVTAWEWFAVGV